MALDGWRTCSIGPDIALVSISAELRKFRQRLETESGEPLHRLELNAADLLSDLIVHLQLGQKQYNEILGAHNIAYLDKLSGTPVTVTVKQ